MKYSIDKTRPTNYWMIFLLLFASCLDSNKSSSTSSAQPTKDSDSVPMPVANSPITITPPVTTIPNNAPALTINSLSNTQSSTNIYTQQKTYLVSGLCNNVDALSVTASVPYQISNNCPTSKSWSIAFGPFSEEASFPVIIKGTQNNNPSYTQQVMKITYDITPPTVSLAPGMQTIQTSPSNVVLNCSVDTQVIKLTSPEVKTFYSPCQSGTMTLNLTSFSPTHSTINLTATDFAGNTSNVSIPVIVNIFAVNFDPSLNTLSPTGPSTLALFGTCDARATTLTLNQNKQAVAGVINQCAQSQTWSTPPLNLVMGSNLFELSAKSATSTTSVQSLVIMKQILPLAVTVQPGSSSKSFALNQITLTPNQTGSFTYSLQNAPSFMTMDSAHSLINAIPNGSGTWNNITLITNSSTQEVVQNFQYQVASGDPLSQHAWHLMDLGQKNHSLISALPGNDIDLGNLFEQTTGKDVPILVSDTSVDISHPDLIDNMENSLHRNYNCASTDPCYTDPTPPSTEERYSHGTSVSGLIAAVGWNGIGTIGVAPESKIQVVNYLDVNAQNSNTAFYGQLSGPYRIMNASWGISWDFSSATSSRPLYTSSSQDVFYRDALLSGVNDASFPKVYLKAAGNNFYDNLEATSDPENQEPYLIVVAATNSRGVSSSYSSRGSNIWISAPGGEFGYDHTVSNANNLVITAPAMITTDVTGCDAGSARISSITNSFDQGHDSANTNCDYTSSFNGTSSATPVVSGVVALMLQVNPQLDWRDIKYILASTARQIDPTSINPNVSKASSPLPTGPAGYIYERGWITNQANFHFHNDYGFGLVDATKAVEMAKTYQSNWGNLIDTRVRTANAYNVLNDSRFSNDIGSYDVFTYKNVFNEILIPDSQAIGVVSTINVTQNITIEAVQVTVHFRHSRPSDVAIELTSPSGTTSTLLHAFNGHQVFNSSGNLASYDFLFPIFLSNAFYGENANGTWGLRIVDAVPGQIGGFSGWGINPIGH